MNLLVTGGAGYIGSHFINLLKDTQHQVWIVDNLRESDKNIISASNLHYEQIDLLDAELLDQVFANKIDAVIHFAAMASVPDSVREPLNYYNNNVIGALNLLSAMQRHNVTKIIASSSAAVYGEPQTEEIQEDHVKKPTKPYGSTKLMIEQIFQDCHQAYGLSSISFRYFCAAGVDNEAGLGEYHTPETHVIPSIVETILGHRANFTIHGNDYDTPDGTPIRDFIHVNDVARAHLQALTILNEQSEPCCEFYNIGSNIGFSVLELIAHAEKLSGKKLNYQIGPRRAGDPSRLISDNSLAKTKLGWEPTESDITTLVASAYKFFQTKS